MKTQRYVLLVLFLAIIGLSIRGQTLKADYQFQGNLNSSVAGAPALTNLGAGNAFVTDTVDGYTRQTLRFPFNNGLSVSTAGGLVPNATYTIVILFRFDQISGYRRVVSFDNRVTDDGAYVLDGRLEFESTNNAPFLASTYIQVVIARDANGTVRAYRDGGFRVNQADGGTFQISPANILSFFQDDNLPPTEASAGNVARIRLYDGAMSTTQVRLLDRLPNTGGGSQPILLSSARDGFQEIYSMNADGSNQLRLTNTELPVETQPRWSPNGQKIAYLRRETSTAVEQIWVMNADGSGQTRLTNTATNDQDPQWRPDGQKIIFSRCDLQGLCDLYTMNPDGTGQAPVTGINTVNDEAEPAYSPDGSKIMFICSTGGTAFANQNICIANADGSNRRQLTNTVSPVLNAAPAFSANGGSITFTRQSDAANIATADIYTMKADGTGQTQLTNNAVLDYDSYFSPDATQIIFRSTRDTISEIYLMNADGTQVSRLTVNSATDLVYDWRRPFPGPCTPTTRTLGQSASGRLDTSSCQVNGSSTDLYTFSGTAGQRMALTMTTGAFASKLELLDQNGAVVATAGGVNGVNNSRLPASGYFTLPSTGTYTVRAISAFGGTGSYTIALYQAPVQTCTYKLGPSSINVPPVGGTYYFDVITQPGCAPASAPSVSGTFYTGASYDGERVTFSMPANSAAADRDDAISIAGLSFVIHQYGIAPPANDGFAAAQQLTGLSSTPGSPVTGYNSGASAQAGELPHAGNTAARSIWYSWTASETGLYSFSTSGSSFDTVLAIYACPATDVCTFANMTPVGSNDDTTFFDKTSKVNFRAAKDAKYVIAIDGKNGATGTTSLSWRQYTRLYRLYLQNFNGNQSNFEPDSVVASNGQNTVSPLKVSQGVYEFDLPADNSVYTVAITGPTGISWDPNNFVLDSSFRYLDELMNGPLEGGQNTVSNATNTTPRYVLGYVKNIASTDLSKLSVMIGNSRGPNPRPPVACAPLSSTTINSTPYATYQCLTQPQTLHDIIPSMPGKLFTLAIKSYDHPIDNDEFGLPGTAFVASDAATYNLSGRVLAGGAGTVVTLTYTPTGSVVEIGQQTTTDTAGNYQFQNLLPGTYRVRARHTGYVYSQPADVNLTATRTLDIAALVTCTYTASTPPLIAQGGGPSEFVVNTNDPTCEWTAATGAPWIVINSGALAGTGPVHFTAQPNTGVTRTGTISVAGQTVVIKQAGVNPVPAIQSIDWPMRKIGTPAFIMTVRGSGFVDTSKVRLNGADRATVYVSDTLLRVQIPQTDFQSVGQSQMTVFSPTPGGGTSNAVPFTTIARPATLFDYDGDRKADVSVFRPGSGIWFISGSAGAVSGVQFGEGTDKLAPADYDGDGKTDIAIYRPSTGVWFIANSSDGTYRTIPFGVPTDIPTPGDFDGDGKADGAVYRPSNESWYVNGSSRGVTVEQFGAPGDIPVVGDYDGDGRADEAVYRPQTDVPNSGIWYLNRTTAGVIGIRFGFSTDKVVPADYDGDGKTDVAVFRPANGVWYQFLSANNTFTGVQYGFGDDVPVPADYDGDGKADVAVFRPSTGSWFIARSSQGDTVIQFGQSGDRPTPDAFGN